MGTVGDTAEQSIVQKFTPAPRGNGRKRGVELINQAFRVKLNFGLAAEICRDGFFQQGATEPLSARPMNRRSPSFRPAKL